MSRTRKPTGRIRPSTRPVRPERQQRYMVSITLGLSAASNIGINLVMQDGGRWGPWVTAFGVFVGILGIAGLILVRTGIVASPIGLDVFAALALAGTTIGFLLHALPSPLTWGSLSAYSALALVGAAATIRSPVVFATFQIFGSAAWVVTGRLFHVPAQMYFNLFPVIPLGAAIAIGFFLAQRNERSIQRSLVAALRNSAETDLLTGLLNRSGFAARAVLALQLQKVTDGSWCAFVDIDHFKAVNDVFGHHRGDQALQEIAFALRGLAGGDDLLVRWGGDEFVMFGTGPAPSESVLASQLNDRENGMIGEAVPRVTVGVAATSPGTRSNVDALVAAADRRMYKLRAGRDAPHSTGERLGSGAGVGE